MVIHAFPAAKLGALLLRHISRPVGNIIKEYAKKHPFFRKFVCMPPARAFNWCEVKLNMMRYNTGKSAKVPPLNDAVAIEMGGNILGEVIIFIIPAVLLWLEVSRQSRKEATKEALKKNELNNLESKINEVRTQLSKHEDHIIQLSNNVFELKKLNSKRSWLSFLSWTGWINSEPSVPEPILVQKPHPKQPPTVASDSPGVVITNATS